MSSTGQPFTARDIGTTTDGTQHRFTKEASWFTMKLVLYTHTLPTEPSQYPKKSAFTGAFATAKTMVQGANKDSSSSSSEASDDSISDASYRRAVDLLRDIHCSQLEKVWPAKQWTPQYGQ